MKTEGRVLKPGDWDGSRVIKATLPRIQAILDAQGLTNGDVGRGTGISVPQISRVFSGKQAPSLAVALRVSAFLGITVEKLAAILPVGSEFARRKRLKR